MAFVGKGGVGKSTVAGTFARLLAQRGRDVLAVDCDPMPGLSFALGLPVQDVTIPASAVDEQPEGSVGPRFVLADGVDAVGAVERYATWGADGVRFLSFGKLRGNVSSHYHSQVAFRLILESLPPDRFDLVGDLPAGTRQPFYGWARFADTVVVVTDPSMKAMLTGRRLARLREASWAPTRLVAVVNRSTGPQDLDRAAEITGLAVVAALADDDAVAYADRRGAAPLDASAQGAFVVGVEQLVDVMCALEEVAV